MEKTVAISGRSSLQKLAIVFAIAMVVLVVVIGFYLEKKRLDIGYGLTTDESNARLEIGDKIFAIPKNHIWSRGDWKGGRVTGTNLQALLPEFEPLTETNRNEFVKPGWDREISILLSEHAMPPNERPTGHTSMTRREVYERITKKQTAHSVDGLFGLKRQEFSDVKELSTSDEIYIGSKRDGSFYWVECSPEGKVPYPSCRTYLEYSDHVYFKYTFAKNRLQDWMQIEDGVLKLIKKFENNLNQGEHK